MFDRDYYPVLLDIRDNQKKTNELLERIVKLLQAR